MPEREEGKIMKKISIIVLMFFIMISPTYAAINETETQDDEGNTYINSGIDSTPVETNNVKEEWVKKVKTNPPVKTLNVSHQTQLNNWYCAPASASMIANYLGYNVNQYTFADLFGTTQQNGTDAGSHLANALNARTGNRFNFQWVWHDYRNISTIRNHVITGVLYGSPVMVNTAEGPGDYHIGGHATGDYLYHYGVVDGYNEYNDTCRYVDPAAGRFPGFIAYQNVSFTSLSYAAGSRGYAW